MFTIVIIMSHLFIAIVHFLTVFISRTIYISFVEG